MLIEQKQQQKEVEIKQEKQQEGKVERLDEARCSAATEGVEPAGADGGRRRKRSGAGGKEEDANDVMAKRTRRHPHAMGEGANGEKGANGTAASFHGDAAGQESGPLTPAFLLQLLKLLRRKEMLLNRAKQHNDDMQSLRQPDEQGGAKKKTESQDATRDKEKEALIKREYAWCVVQVDRANFQLRNALWGVALGLHAHPTTNAGASNTHTHTRVREVQDDEEASARDSLIALSRGDVRDGAGEDSARRAGGGSERTRNQIVRRCDESAAKLLRAVAGSADVSASSSRCISHGRSSQPCLLP
jgi:hypothetical protein